MFDLTVSKPDFNATTLTFTAATDKGREFLAAMFGAGAVSIELPKSRGADLMVYARRKGLSVEGAENDTEAADYQNKIAAMIEALDLDAISEALGEAGCDHFLAELGKCRNAAESLALFELAGLL